MSAHLDKEQEAPSLDVKSYSLLCPFDSKRVADAIIDKIDKGKIIITIQSVTDNDG